MARCDLKVVLDGMDEVYRPGETVTGRVEVETDEAVTLDALTVELAWHTHGRGTPASGTAAEATVFEGEIDGSGPRHFPFELTVPAGPYTYHGEHLNVDWAVRARADVPWKLDPKTEAPVVVLPPRGEDDEAPEPAPEVVASIAPATADRPRRPLPPAGSVGSLVGGGCIALPFLVPGLVMAWFGLSAVLRHWLGTGTGGGEPDGNMVLFSLIGPAFALAGLALLFGAYFKWRSARRLGEVTLDLDRNRMRRGEAVEWRLAFTPRQQVNLLGIKGWVEAEERTTRGTGTRRSTVQHELLKHETTLSPARRLLAGEPLEVQGSFTIPDDAPLSFGAPNNHVTWTVHCAVTVDLATGWNGFELFAVVG